MMISAMIFLLAALTAGAIVGIFIAALLELNGEELLQGETPPHAMGDVSAAPK